MPKSPDKPSSENRETSGGLNFRTAIFLVLAGITTGAIGGYFLGKKGTEQPNKSDITDVRNTGSESTDQRTLKLQLRQCQSHIFGAMGSGCEQLSEEELQRQYLESEKARREKRAEEIFKRLGIYNPVDQEKIRQLINRGCTELKSGSGKQIRLSAPPMPEKCSESDSEPFVLFEEPQKNFYEISDEDYKKLSEEDKKLVDLYNNKQYSEILKDFNLDRERDLVGKLASEDSEFQKLGLDKMYNQFIEDLEGFRNDMANASSLDERRKVICKIIEYERTAVKPTDEQRKKIEQLSDNGITLRFQGKSHVQVLVETFFNLSGFKSVDDEEIMEQCGISADD